MLYITSDADRVILHRGVSSTPSARLRISQVDPVNPATHEHEALPPTSLQTPLFKHGFGTQGPLVGAEIEDEQYNSH